MEEQELRNICIEHLEELCHRNVIYNFRIKCDEENNPPSRSNEIQWDIYIEQHRGLGVRAYHILWPHNEVVIETIGQISYFEELLIKLRNEKIEEILER